MTNKKAAADKTAAIPTYPGPNLWGVRLVRVEGVVATLVDVSCDWRLMRRTALVRFDDGREIAVDAATLGVVG